MGKISNGNSSKTLNTYSNKTNCRHLFETYLDFQMAHPVPKKLPKKWKEDSTWPKLFFSHVCGLLEPFFWTIFLFLYFAEWIKMKRRKYCQQAWALIFLSLILSGSVTSGLHLKTALKKEKSQTVLQVRDFLSLKESAIFKETYFSRKKTYFSLIFIFQFILASNIFSKWKKPL